MITLARQYAALILDALISQPLSSDGILSDEAEAAIDKTVSRLTKPELYELIWDTMAIDSDLPGNGEIDDTDPRVMLRNIAGLCIKHEVFLLTRHWQRRDEALQAARARLVR